MTAQKAKKAAIILCILGIVLLGISGILLMAGLSGNAQKTELSLDDYLQQGKKYFERGDYQEAILTYDKAAQIDEDNPEILMGLGLAYADGQYYQKAEETYQEVLNLDGSNAEACLELAQVYLSQGKLDECKTLLEAMSAKIQNEEINNMYAQTRVAAPEFSLTSGAYDQYQLLEITSMPANSVVYYTLNGEEPTRQNNIFSEGIVISNPETTFRAKAYNNLGYSSETVTLDLKITVPVEKVIIEDSGMRYILEEYLGVNYRSDIYNYQLAQIRELYVVGEEYWYSQDELAGAHFDEEYVNLNNDKFYTNGEVTDLTVLKYCPFLKSLNIVFEPELSLAGIENLTSLESLSLQHNHLVDITPLSTLTGLKQLSLGWNDISDITPLSGLNNLQTLGLWGNDISDISALAEMESLYYLDISDNVVSDISVVSGMPHLSELWMYENEITDLSPVNSLTELQVLMVRNNPISNYGNVKERAYDLKRLDLEE